MNSIEQIPLHLGEALKDELRCRGISQKRFASDIGVRYRYLNNILRKNRPVDVRFALLCERALGIPACALLRLQTVYDIVAAKQDRLFAERLENVRTREYFRVDR